MPSALRRRHRRPSRARSDRLGAAQRQLTKPRSPAPLPHHTTPAPSVLLLVLRVLVDPNNTQKQTMLAQSSSRVMRANVQQRARAAVVARPARRSAVSVSASHGQGLPIDLRGAFCRGPHWRLRRARMKEGVAPLSCLLLTRLSSSSRLTTTTNHRQEGLHCRRGR